MKFIFYLIYNIVLTFIVPFVWVMAFFNDKLGQSLAGQKDVKRRVLSFRNKVEADPKPVIWLHAASAGEFEQIKPLLSRLSKLDVYVFQTFTSATIFYKSSQDRRFHGVCFLPWDLYPRVRRFVTLLKPDIFINTRHDVWPNLYLAVKQAGVRSVLINANLYAESMRLKPVLRQFNAAVFNQIDQIYTGSGDLGSLLRRIYAGPLDVVGDSRFDQVYERAQKNTKMLISPELVSDRRVIVYGSVGDSDLPVITSAIAKLPTDKAFLHIIVPHETKEKDIIPWEAEFFRIRHKSIRKSEIEQYQGESVLIWDSVGQLADLYKYADLAFIGAGFGAGVHSVTEAAVYAVPSAHGPKYDILAEAIELVDLKLSHVVLSEDDLFDFLVQDQALRNNTASSISKFIDARIGATDRIFSREPQLANLTPR